MFALTVNDLTRQLHQRFGFARFRPGQAEVIQAVLDRRDAMAVMPTGQGKSLCYQFPATLLPGMTLVVSPLIALMHDQVEGLLQRNIAAAAFHSGLTEAERDRVIQALRLQRLKLLYLAPERMQHEGFLRLLRACFVSLLVVDEAHCLSQWGHDFRPDYLRIGQLRQSLHHPPCLALTATATKRVQDDCAERLALRNPLRLVTGFRRPNLALSVRRCFSRCEKLAALDHLVQACPAGTVLIYCATRRAVQEVAAWLRQSVPSVGYYHAGLSDEARRLVHEEFRGGRIRLLVATNAFGMGIDKPDVRLVVHFDLPGSLEAYYQEAGRAGRDGAPASCVLLFQERDVATQEYFIQQASTESGAEQAGRMQTLLNEMIAYVSVQTCRQLAILDYFNDDNERVQGPCGLCDRCGSAARRGDVVSRGGSHDEGPAAVLRTVAWGEGRLGVSRLVEILRGSRFKTSAPSRHGGCPTDGACRAQSKSAITRWLNDLIDAGYVRVEGVDDPTLALTASGQSAVNGEGQLVLNQTNPSSSSGRSTKPARPAISRVTVPLDDPRLFERLRRLRAELAEEEGVAPFVIFHDKTLRTIANQKPLTPDALLDIPGIGDVKVERYGRRVLAVVSGEHE